MRLTSILKKVAMAITGLGLFVFLIAHLSGNLLILMGPEAFNAYPVKLRELGPLLYAAEAGLAAFFVLHIYSGIRVTLENRKARPERYEVANTAGEATLASRSMAIGGVLLAVFLIIHLKMFKFSSWDVPNGLWGLVVDTFGNPLWVAFYELAMIALGLHLSHGFSSAFQTLGALKPRWRPRMRQVGFALGWALAIGFMILPIWSHSKSSARPAHADASLQPRNVP
jgi:succinate dehydrogenase / fumarate reductase, cytochrome b subunit